MDKTFLKFDDTEIEKYKLHQYERPVLIDNIDVNEMVVSSKISRGKNDFKYFIGYKDTKTIRSLCMFLQKKSAYRRDFDKTECMSFLAKDEKLLEKYKKNWKKVSNITKKELESNPVYNEKCIKTKIKEKQNNTSFHNNKIPKEDSEYTFLSVILIDPVFRAGENYYLQVILEECKYIIKDKKQSIKKFITNNIEISSDDSDKENFYKENSNKEN